jgi:hypothetical protein
MSQKECLIAKRNNQNLINIYVFLFKAMAIMASYCFFIHMNVKKFKPKIHLMNNPILNLGPLKVNMNTLNKS